MATVSWLEVKLNATTEAVDWVRTALASVAQTPENSTEVSLNVHPWSMAPRLESAELWDCQLTLWFRDDGPGRGQLAAWLQKLSPLERSGLVAAAEVTPYPQRPEDAPTPVQHLGQFVIVPTGTGVDYSVQPHEQPIWLRPSASFGSGYHPATMLSLRLIERYVHPPQQVLDLGTGSGILGLACARLGAKVLALDNDPIAIQACQVAIKDNDLTSQITAQVGSLGAGNQFGHWLGEDYGGQEPAELLPEPRTLPFQFDVIVANLLGRLHLALVPDYAASLSATRSQGILITAGFTQDYRPTVEDALTAAGFQLLAQETSQEWVALAHTI